MSFHFLNIMRRTQWATSRYRHGAPRCDIFHCDAGADRRGRNFRGTIWASFHEIKELQVLQSPPGRGEGWSRRGERRGTVEKWTFQLITPRSGLPLIALAVAECARGRGRDERTICWQGGGEGEREGKSHLARFINFTGTRELFKLQRPDQPRSSLISLVFSPAAPRRDRHPSGFSCPGNPLDDPRRGGGNYYVGRRGITAVNPIYAIGESAWKGASATKRASDSPRVDLRWGRAYINATTRATWNHISTCTRDFPLSRGKS